MHLARRHALALWVVIAACGGTSSDVVPTIESTVFAAGLNVDLAASTRLPSGQYLRDLEVGDGALAVDGALLDVHYSGWLTNGALFDTNQEPNAPFSFHYARGEVIRGWDHGFTGMKVGGSRQLVIPPSLGYGSAGAGSHIPPNAILVFNVTLVGVH